jgi:PAS domain S-box-containing protein
LTRPGVSDSAALRARLALVEAQLQEANETLDAIRNGEVDAVVVGGPGGQFVYTLQNADRPYRVLVEQMKEGALTFAGDGTILYCNQRFADLVAGRPEEIVGGSIFTYVKNRSSVEEMIASQADGQSVEFSMVTATGGEAPVNMSIAELDVEEGGNRLLCGIVTDLTQNYSRARELAEANVLLAAEIAERTRVEESLAIALDAAGMGSWDLALDTDVANRSLRHDAIFGHDVMLAHWGLAIALEHFMPEDREAVEAAFAEAEKVGHLDLEGRIRRANDGALRWLHLKGRTFYGDSGPERISGVVIDITARRLAEDGLRQSQKLEAMGQLTGGVAHDFNNLLTPIIGGLDMLQRRGLGSEREQRLIEGALQSADRAKTLVQRLLSFARRQPLQSVSVDLASLVMGMADLIASATGPQIEVVVDVARDLPAANADLNQLEMAILNLSVNARDAMTSGGTLRISAAAETIEPGHSTALEPGPYIRLSVADTGAGMDEATLAKAIEPFFSTKGVGKGTGLGLSMVHGLAAQLGGALEISSQSGLGTDVAIWLPINAGVPSLTEEDQPTAGSRMVGTALLVDDEALVRMSTADMLTDLGFAVVEAASAEEALVAIDQGVHFDVLITDHLMPGKTGVDLAGMVQKQRPGIPVLLVSGFAESEGVASTMPRLIKPFRQVELAARLIGLMAEKAR